MKGFQSVVFVYVLLILTMSFQKIEATVKGDLANQVNLKIIQDFEEKYGLHLLGVRIGGPEKINLMGLIFRINKLLTEEEARRLIVNCSREYLSAILNKKELQQYLEESFNIKNINLIISVFENDKYVMAPKLCSVHCFEEDVRYVYYELIDGCHRAYRNIETFEEAAAIVDAEDK